MPLYRLRQDWGTAAVIVFNKQVLQCIVYVLFGVKAVYIIFLFVFNRVISLEVLQD